MYKKILRFLYFFNLKCQILIIVRFAIPKRRIKQIGALFVLNYLVWHNTERPRIKYRLFKRDNTLSIENGPRCIHENNSPEEKRERERERKPCIPGLELSYSRRNAQGKYETQPEPIMHVRYKREQIPASVRIGRTLLCVCRFIGGSTGYCSMD